MFILRILKVKRVLLYSDIYLIKYVWYLLRHMCCFWVGRECKTNINFIIVSVDFISNKLWYIHTHTYTYTLTSTHTLTHIHTHKYTHIHAHSHLHKHTYIHTHKYNQIHIHKYNQIHIHKYTYISRYTYASYKYTYINTHIRTLHNHIHKRTQSHIYTYAFIRIYTQIHTYANTLPNTHACMVIHSFVYMCDCAHTMYIYTRCIVRMPIRTYTCVYE